MWKLGLVAGTLIGLSAVAQAAGPYVSGQAGVSIVKDANNSGGGVAIESSFDTGWAFSGAVGYAFANGLRLEGEAGYRQNGLDKLKIVNDGGLGVAAGVGSLTGRTASASGDVGALNLMANGWYEFKTGIAFTPYLGGGIGLARVSINNVATSGARIVDDEDIVFAYQFGAGVAYTMMPSIDLTLDYRYVATDNPSFKDVTGTAFTSEVHSHSIMAGLRFDF